ncbi:MAG: ABC transporter permease, partial [Pollutimonas bauzanensis]
RPAVRSDSAPPRRGVRRNALPAFSTIAAWMVYLYLVLPSLTVIPISFSQGYSFSSFSLKLYQQLFQSSGWMSSMANSAIIATIASSLAIVAGVPAAYAFSRGRFRGKSIAQLLVVCPLFVPVIVISLGIYFLGAKTGTLGSHSILVLAHSMYAMPFVVVMVLSGLRQVDPSLERAAYIMGASTVRIFFQIILPQLRISIIAGWVFSFLVSFDEVIIAWFISGPDTQTLPVRMYSSIMWDNTPEIAAVSTLLTALSLLICLVMIRVGGIKTVTPSL